jgi:hypothetical protein
MGGKQHNPKMGGYKGVECQDLEKDIVSDSNPNTPSLPSKINAYKVAGHGKISRSGDSLAIKLDEEDGTERFFTLLLTDIYLMHNDFRSGRITVITVREYDNAQK